MTDEEINKKAEKHCNEVLCNAHEKCNEFIKCRDWRSRRAGFFCGYEQALKDVEKENAELKEMYHESDEDNNKLRENIPKLAEAKEIIEKLYAVYYEPCVTESDLKYRDELFAEVKQFLKE